MKYLGVNSDYFINNKFCRAYYSIINKADNQNRISLSSRDISFIYYENHHIIPRCLGGKDQNNTVLLTGFEHFVCHWLLPKFVKEAEAKTKLFHALRFMRHKNNLKSIKQVALLYERAKIEIAQASSLSKKGKKRTSEYAAMMKERMTGSGNFMFGKTHLEKNIRENVRDKKGKQI